MFEKKRESFNRTVVYMLTSACHQRSYRFMGIIQKRNWPSFGRSRTDVACPKMSVATIRRAAPLNYCCGNVVYN